MTREYKAALTKAERKAFRSQRWAFRRDPESLTPEEQQALYFTSLGPAGRPDRGQSPRQHPAACRHTVGPSPMIDGG